MRDLYCIKKKREKETDFCLRLKAPNFNKKITKALKENKITKMRGREEEGGGGGGGGGYFHLS